MPQRRSHHAPSANHELSVRVTHAASTKQSRAGAAAHGAQRLVRHHPLTSVGIVLGGGVVLGALAHKLFEHKQTFSEALAERLGVNQARDRLRKWI